LTITLKKEGEPRGFSRRHHHQGKKKENNLKHKHLLALREKKRGPSVSTTGEKGVTSGGGWVHEQTPSHKEMKTENSR